MVTRKTTRRTVQKPVPPVRIKRTTAKAPLAASPKASLESARDILCEERTRTELATAAVVGIAAAIIEIELLPGILLGMAAMLVPKLFPNLPQVGLPLLKSGIGLGFQAMDKAQRLIADASDRAQDILAEVKADATHARRSKAHATTRA